MLQGGISSLGLGISLLWTESRRRLTGPEAVQFGIAEIIRWTSERTAARVSLQASKGRIQVGLDASFAGASGAFDGLAQRGALISATLPLQSSIPLPASRFLR